MDKKKLQGLLSVKSADILHKGRLREWMYAHLIDLPVINNAFQKFYDIEFASQDTDNIFNLWKGHAFEILPESVPIKAELLAPYFQHLERIICNNNPEHFRVLLLKDAWMFQHPNEHLQWATVLMGEQGAGKNRYTDMLCDLWGGLNWTQPNINNISMITDDKHRDLIAFKKLIVSNELASLESNHGKGREANWEILKSKFTKHTHAMRNLYEDPIPVQNVNNYIFCTNNWDSIRLGVRDRRCFVLEVSGEEIGNIQSYFIPLCKTFTDEMKTHLLNFYLRFDTTGFDVHEPPPDSNLTAEIMESQLHSAEVWIKEFQFSEEGCFTLEQLFGKYIAWCDEHYLTGTDVSKPGTGFARRIAKYCHVSK
jgi:hypothetical protein